MDGLFIVEAFHDLAVFVQPGQRGAVRVGQRDVYDMEMFRDARIDGGV